jgi:hypothetical protein
VVFLKVRDKLRILLICTNADLAGAPVHTNIICNHLALNDAIDFEVVFGEPGPIVSSLIGNGVVCHILSRLKSKISPINDIILLFQLIFLLRQYKPDLVHLHSSNAGMIGRLACFILGLPSIYTVHGWGWRGFGAFKTKLVFLIEKVLASLKGVFYIYVSRSVELEAIQKLGIKKKTQRFLSLIMSKSLSSCFCPPLAKSRLYKTLMASSTFINDFSGYS